VTITGGNLTHLRALAPRFKRFNIEPHPGNAIVFYAFDLLHFKGEDLNGAALQERRAQLPQVLNDSGVPPVNRIAGNHAAGDRGGDESGA